MNDFHGFERPLPVSDLSYRFSRGKFVVTAELSPPVSTDPGDFVARAQALKGLATAVNVTDGAGAKAHLSSMVAAHFLLKSGIEPILQLTCRDRNRLALQGELLDRKSTRLNSSHLKLSRMPSSA